MKKIRTSIYLTPETLKQAQDNIVFSNSRTQSDFIEKSIEFYCSFLHAEQSKEVFSRIFLSTFKGALDVFEDRVSRLLFKNAVEISMMMHVVAATSSIDGDSLSRLRGMCVNEVKKSNGNLSFEKAWEYQRGGN